MAERRQRFGLVSYFERGYMNATGEKLVINRYSGQWDADALIESYGYADCKSLVDRYFSITDGPSWKRFVSKADKIYHGAIEEKEDLEQRRIMKQRAAAWMNE